MEIKTISVDIGNDSVKAINGQGERYYIPNVIATTTRNRNITEMEKTLENALHVEVFSPALKDREQTLFVGELARQQVNKSEMQEDTWKSESDQSLIMLLTTIALDAVKNITDEKKVHVIYNLSTGLPLAESVNKGTRKNFRDKIQNNTHTVRFLETPLGREVEVMIQFDKVVVSPEGKAAYIQILTSGDKDIATNNIGIIDVGGLTTDIAVIKAGGEVDNNGSRPVSVGASTYLDMIKKDIHSVHRHTVASRKKVVEIILNDGIFLKNGRPEDATKIIDKHLNNFTEAIFKEIKVVFSKSEDISFAYLVGGGSALVADRIEKLNIQDCHFPLKKYDAKTSIWTIVESYDKILKLQMQQA